MYEPSSTKRLLVLRIEHQLMHRVDQRKRRPAALETDAAKLPVRYPELLDVVHDEVILA